MTPSDVTRQAIAWHVGLPEATESEWTAFVAWLEADPAHIAAYDQVSTADADRLDALRSVPHAANDIAPVVVDSVAPGRRWRARLAGAGVAVAAALVAVLVLRPTEPPASVQTITAIGAPRAVTLGGGVQVALGRGARLVIDPVSPRRAVLAAGPGHFVVRHDAAHPFRLDLGGHALIDLGTVFDVDNGATRITVAVSEGGVLFDPTKADVAVHAGQRLVYDRAADIATVTGAAPALQHLPHAGSLSFVDAPLPDVTAAIARASATRIMLDAALEGRRFTGVIRLTGSASRDVPHFADATGTRSTRDGDHWRIGPAGEASR